jgi:DNA-binding IclR family transcriptional regulator
MPRAGCSGETAFRASELGMSISTTLRYLKTWVAVGVLEQVSKTRRYRLAIQWRHDVLTSQSRPALPAAI